MAEIEVQSEDSTASESGASATFDFHYGETDLAENHVRWRGGTYIVGGVLFAATLACVGVLVVGSLRFMNFVQGLTGGSQNLSTEQPAGSTQPILFLTNTSSPTLFLPTVTADAPPTRTLTPTVTITPTPGPCMQTVQAGDNLIVLVSRCGHRDLDVIDLVLEINNLSAPEVIQVGQTLEIPWPTPTEAAEGEGTPEDASAPDEEAAMIDPLALSVAEVDGIESFSGAATATLQAGVTWHQVVRDETIISIAITYGADIKILSELNPEVAFSQCDFGQFGGGPSCVVNLFEGQSIRVPAPTPTPTLSPTPSGSETATATATPTFNAPSAISPSNRALFQPLQLVTLRWVASGTLGANQVYRVMIDDLTSGDRYTADTTDLFFIMPTEWQGRDGQRHDYSWSVSVIDTDNPEAPYFTTEARMFTWESTSNASS